MIDETSQNSNNVKPRIIVLISFFAFCYLILILKLCGLSINQTKSFNNQVNFSKDFQSKLANRSIIIDQNEALLATNIKTVSLYAKANLIKEPDFVARNLAKIFPDFDRVKFEKSFNSGKKFIWIKRNITPKEQFAVNNLGIPALEFEESYKRVYPNGNLFSHIIGYVGLDGNGLAGVERSFDNYLSNDNKEALRLSLDLRVQTIVHEELKNAVIKNSAEAGVAIIMNANTGEIIALVNLPDFDPYHPGNAKPESIFNKATLGLYEMGSVAKPFTFAIALEEKVTDVNHIYNVEEPTRINNFQIKDNKGKGGWLSLPEIFMYSSNIGTNKIIKEVGKEKQIKWLKNLGLLDKLEIEILEKSTPLYPSFDKWKEINMLTISFGHGISLTPLHIVKANAILLNGGYKIEPTLLKLTSPVKRERVISAETSDKMRRLYRLVVEQGSGRRADVDGYFVGGKSGSAEKIYKGRYSAQAGVICSFIGAFPIYNPEYVILTMIDDPKTGSANGGLIAAPIVAKIIARIAPILNIRPVNDDDAVIREQLYLKYNYQINQLDSS